MSIIDTMTKTIGPVKEKAALNIDSLAKVAGQLDMKDTVDYLRTSATDLRSDNFNIITVGRFKNGKSTLMNALLGRLTHPVPELAGVGPMPTDALPCTAALTSIKYAVTPYVKVQNYDGKVQDWSFSKYLREAVVKDNEEDTIKFFEKIMQFEVGLPAELCQSGVTLIDSPGLGDTPKRNEITSMAISRCDAAIVVYRSEPFAGMDEVDFAIQQVAGTKTRVFTVINMYNEDASNVSDRFKRFAWNRLVGKDRGGPDYSGQNFADKDIFFVNAKEAFTGKLNGNAELMQKSGISLLEQRLADFLVKERHYVHMTKFVREADNGAAKIEATIGQRKAALQADQQKLQQKFEEIQPQLAGVRARRDKIGPLFDQASREARRAVKTSFEQMITQLRMDLPLEMANNRKLPSEGSLGATVMANFKQKQLCKEAGDICTEIITERIAQWGKNPPSKPGANQALEPVMEILSRDLEDEAAQIDRAMRDIHFQMTGWTPPTGPTNVVSTNERVLSALGSLALGDVFGAITGGGGGWRGAAGAIVAHVGSIVVLGAMGLLAAPIAIPAIILAAIFGGAAAGGIGMGKRVREKVAAHVVETLKEAPKAADSQIETQINKLFKDMEREALKVVQAVIEEEETNIRQMLELNKRNQADREKALAVLNDMGNAVTTARQGLKNVDVAFAQAA